MRSGASWFLTNESSLAAVPGISVQILQNLAWI